MEALPGGCILDLEVVSEERCTREEAMLYPANACRNRALTLAQTEVRHGAGGSLTLCAGAVLGPALSSDDGRIYKVVDWQIQVARAEVAC